MAFSKSISEALSEAEVSLEKALQGAFNIENQLFNAEILHKLEKAISGTKTKENKFTSHFDRLELRELWFSISVSPKHKKGDSYESCRHCEAKMVHMECRRSAVVLAVQRMVWEVLVRQLRYVQFAMKKR